MKKHIILTSIFILLCFCCCSQKQSNNKDFVFSKIVKEKLSNNIEGDNQYYISYNKLDDKYIVELNVCNKCYLFDLLQKSENTIKVQDNLIKILSKDEIQSFEPKGDFIINTGGSYIIELDLQGKIIKSYTSD